MGPDPFAHRRRALRRAPRTFGRTLVDAGCALLLLLLLGATGIRPAAAQELLLKRSIPVMAAGSCPRAASAVPPTLQEREEARQLITAGDQAALLGDQRGARDHFRRATRHDPLNADLAYRLARTHEELGESGEAASEYCRYLALAPEAADAAEIRDRIELLAPPQGLVSERAAEAFLLGVAAYDEDRLRDAHQAFAAAVRFEPSWADAYYNRALTLLRQERPAQAMRDLEEYLSRASEAEDRAEVEARLAAIEALLPAPSPAGALVRGVLIPGLGQLYTRRPALGLLVLGGAATTAYLAFQPQTVTRTTTCLDPNQVEYPCPTEVVEYPYRAAGLAGAAAISLLGALEAYFFAERRQSPPAAATDEPAPQPASPAGLSLSRPILLPTAEGVSLHFELRLPARR